MDSVRDDLLAGDLIVSVRDGMNCLGFVSFDIPQPDALTVNIDTTNISCFGETDGIITPLVSGGTKGYQYAWSNSTNDSIATDLISGQYFLTVTDANGCITPAAAFVSEPPRLDIMIDSTRDVICFGDQTGAVYFAGAGGSPPFTYSIDGNRFSDALSFDGLGAGVYNVTIKDNRGCTQTVMAEIDQPLQLSVNAGQDTTIDLGFTAQLLATHRPLGKPVNYSWSPPQSLDCDDCPFPRARPLTSTTYTVSIIDDTGCTASDQITVLVFLNRPVYIPN
jgi:hypothetical protein